MNYPFPKIDGKLAIPKLSDERLDELAKRIRPLYFHNGELTWMKVPHLKNTAFTWSPKPDKKAEGLLELTTIRTLHVYAYYGFKPSIAEVLAQIPAEFEKEVAGFRTIGPEDSAEMEAEIDAFNAGFHVATTILYKNKIEIDFTPSNVDLSQSLRGTFGCVELESFFMQIVSYLQRNDPDKVYADTLGGNNDGGSRWHKPFCVDTFRNPTWFAIACCGGWFDHIWFPKGWFTVSLAFITRLKESDHNLCKHKS